MKPIIKREGKFTWKHHRRLLNKMQEIRLIYRRTNNAKSTKKLFIFNNPMTPKICILIILLSLICSNNTSATNEIHLRIKMKFVPKNLLVRTTKKKYKNRNVHKHENRDIQKIFTVCIYIVLGTMQKKKRTTILFM